MFVFVRQDMQRLVTVDTVESQGLRQKENVQFVEMDTWRNLNVGKTPPAASCDRVEVMGRDGNASAKDGVWQARDPKLEGKAEVHDFERYRDSSTRKTTQLHNSATHGCLSEDHAAEMVEAAAASLKIARPLTLEELSSLVADEAEEEDDDSASGNVSEEQGTDDDDAQQKCGEVSAPFFKSIRNNAAGKAKSQPKKSSSGGGGAGTKTKQIRWLRWLRWH